MLATPLFESGLFKGGLFNGGLLNSETYHVYVDSVAGSDLNDGATSDRAIQTLTKASGLITEFGEGCRVGLARGSVWRDKLTINQHYTVVGAYGDGDKPLIDGADIFTGWTKTPGYVNIYQATITVLASALAVSTPGVWEDSVRFRNFASGLADLDTKPGAFWHGALSGSGSVSITVYIHTTASNNPAINGSLYELSVRDSCIDSAAAFVDYVKISDIDTKRPYSSYGGIAISRYSKVERCSFSEGTAHNSFMRSGSEMIDCVALDCYSQFGSPTMYILYDHSSIGGTIGSIGRFTRCVAQVSDDIVKPVGFYAHSNSLFFGNVIYEECQVLYTKATGFEAASTEQLTLINCITDSANTHFVSAVPIVVNGGTANNSLGLSGATTGVLSGSSIQHSISGLVSNLNTTGNLRLTGSSQTLFLEDSQITLANICILDTGTNNNVNVNNCTLGTRNNAAYQFYSLSAGTTFVGDHNTFINQGKWTKGGVDYTTLAAWRAASGQDANSVTG